MARFRVASLSAIISFLTLALGVLRSASQEYGFQSINCGGTAFTDTKTKLHWEKDPFYNNNNDLLYGRSSTVHSSFQNITLPMTTLRYFPSERKNGKFCYPLDVSSGSTYFVRASFLYGNYDGLGKPPNFQLIFNYNILLTIYTSLSTTPVVHELTFVSQWHELNICVASDNSSNSIPFISTIELHLLNNTMYNERGSFGDSLNAFALNYGLMLWRRINYGARTQLDVRYPDDTFDRIWEANTTGPTLSINTTQIMDEYYGQDKSKPPPAVMATAITSTHGSNLTFTYEKYGGFKGFRMEMHFQELDPKIRSNQSPPRQLSLTFRNTSGRFTTTPSFHPASAGPSNAVFDQEEELPQTFQITVYTDAASSATPLLNAIELFHWTNGTLSTIGTSPDDVHAIMHIQESLNIAGYGQGDPCLPKPYAWTWIACNDDTPPRIIDINLANHSLSGSIPPFINNLTDLQRIDLSHNMLTGPIPDVSNLHALQYLDVSYNNLCGRSPSLPTSVDYRNIGNNGVCDDIACKCDSSQTSSTSALPTTNKNKKYIFIISFMGGLYILLLLIIFIICMVVRIKKEEEKATPIIKSQNKDDAADAIKFLPFLTKMFTYNEMKDATFNFTSLLGEGGFGKVYRGLLPTNAPIAVKLLVDASRQGVKEFYNEVAILSRVRHKNLVSLVGYCVENTYMLIYEYIEKGNLKDLLYGDVDSIDKPLPWKTRLHIALDASQGLDYLHTGCDPPIIHRDVKSSNILLSEKMQAKVADFGLSRLKEGDTTISHVSTHNVVGTAGYLDPAYNATNHLTDKSDVYSFGVVLLELICGRAPIDMFNTSPYIVEWVKFSIMKGKVKDIVDPILTNQYNVISMMKVVDLAIGCVDNDRMRRPKMRQVFEVLQDALQIEISSPPLSTDNSGSSSTDEKIFDLHYIKNIKMTITPR